jgi:hypothetical protein
MPKNLSKTVVPPREKMTPGARKMRDSYALQPDAPIYQEEFGFYVLDRWKNERHIAPDISGAEMAKFFGYDPPGKYCLWNLGWCEAEFDPVFEEKILEDHGEYELVQDFAGRSI